jgi:hypothetical protein
MKQYILGEFSIKSVKWTPLVVIGITMPPRDPDDDEEEEEEDEGEEEGADEPPVVREPDED